MNKSSKLLFIGCMPVAMMALFLTGCQMSSAPTETYSIETPSTTPSAEVSTLPTPSAVPTPSPSEEPSESVNHEAHVAANEVRHDPASGVAPAATTKPAPKPKVDEKDAYQQEKPTLMGLQLGTDQETVVNRFGKAKSQFVMDEDEITVYEYTDFSVGFNNKNKLEFVDVHSADIDPGLGGLKLGQKPEDAIRILGTPDSNSSFVLTYKAQGTVLKLDVDPKENSIQSIKLFAE